MPRSWRCAPRPSTSVIGASMCAGAIVGARVARLVYGPQDPKAGGALSLYNVPQDPRLNHVVDVVPGVLADASVRLLQGFFGDRRLGER